MLQKIIAGHPQSLFKGLAGGVSEEKGKTFKENIIL